MLEDTLVEEDIHPVYVSEGVTDTGKVRTANQDAFVQIGTRGVWAVADGYVFAIAVAGFEGGIG